MIYVDRNWFLLYIFCLKIFKNLIYMNNKFKNKRIIKKWDGLINFNNKWLI